MKHLSIGERLKKAKSLEARVEIALDWTENWVSDHDKTLSLIKSALIKGDVKAAERYLHQLKTLNEKRFSALPNLIDKLADEDIL